MTVPVPVPYRYARTAHTVRTWYLVPGYLVGPADCADCAHAHSAHTGHAAHTHAGIHCAHWCCAHFGCDMHSTYATHSMHAGTLARMCTTLCAHCLAGHTGHSGTLAHSVHTV